MGTEPIKFNQQACILTTKLCSLLYQFTCVLYFSEKSFPSADLYVLVLHSGILETAQSKNMTPLLAKLSFFKKCQAVQTLLAELSLQRVRCTAVGV